MGLKTILVGYDGTDSGQRALSRAVEFSKVFHSRLIVAVVEQVAPGSIASVGVGDMPIAVSEPSLGGWERELQIERARAFVDTQDIPYEILSPVGSAATELVELAAENDADLIVVGTHEPGLFERLLAGSVSGSVARMAACDVLVVHPKR